MKYLEMFDKIENEDYIIEDISNNIADDENSGSNSKEEDESRTRMKKIMIKKMIQKTIMIILQMVILLEKENKIIYPKNENNDKSKNKNNNIKGNNKNKTKYNCSNELVFNDKFKFNLKKLLRKRTYNDMIKEQKKIFGNMEVEIKPIHLYKKEKKGFNNYGEYMINFNKELYDTYLKLNSLNLK